MKGSYAVYLNEVEQAASADPQILEAAAPVPCGWPTARRTSAVSYDSWTAAT
ncbi:hypothetical protein ACFVIZ_14670 [Streptomyces anulatus]|uniref:hypothetical protein n=1 Tax=Streptomyces anulatus TaxID=1892 RepID=UPI003632019D